MCNDSKFNAGVACFCFGVTDECSELVWRRETLMNMNSGWNITDFDSYTYSFLMTSVNKDPDIAGTFPPTPAKAFWCTTVATETCTTCSTGAHLTTTKAIWCVFRVPYTRLQSTCS